MRSTLAQSSGRRGASQAPVTLVAKCHVEPSDVEGVLLTEASGNAAAQASGGSRRESCLAHGRGLVNAQQLVSGFKDFFA